MEREQGDQVKEEERSCFGIVILLLRKVEDKIKALRRRMRTLTPIPSAPPSIHILFAGKDECHEPRNLCARRSWAHSARLESAPQ